MLEHCKHHVSFGSSCIYICGCVAVEPLRDLIISPSCRCLRDGELFEIIIQKMVDRWSGSIEAGAVPT